MPCHNHSRYPSYPHMLLLHQKKYFQNCEFILFLDLISLSPFSTSSFREKCIKEEETYSHTQRENGRRITNQILMWFSWRWCVGRNVRASRKKQCHATITKHHQRHHTHSNSPSLPEFSTSTQYATFHHYYHHCFVHTFLQMMKIRWR